MIRNAIIAAGILLAGCQTPERAMAVAKANQIIQNLANNTKCQEAFQTMPRQMQDLLMQQINVWNAVMGESDFGIKGIGNRRDRQAKQALQVIAIAPTACSE